MAKSKIDVKYVKEFQNGSIEAFDVIYEYYKNPIYYFSYTIVRSEADAEEVVQETFTKVYTKINTLLDASAFHAWIFSITYNNAITLRNKNVKSIGLAEETNLEDIISSKDNQVISLSNKELIKAVRAEIEKMPEKYVQAAMLRYFDNFSIEEISTIIDVPIGTVKSRLSKVRSTIQPILKRKGFTPSKYFSFSMAPILFKSFAQIIKQYEMSPTTSSELYKYVTGGTLATYTTSSSIGLSAKIAISSVLFTGVGIVGVYQITNSNEPPQIESISYHKELTNKSIEVEVSLSDVVKEDAIVLKDKNTTMEFELKENKMLFEVKNNGSYTIEVNGEKETLEINNIDKVSPTLENVNYENSKLSFNVNDNLSGIDYEKSYFNYNDEQHSLLKNKHYDGEFKGIVVLYLVDKLNNMREYEITIDE